MKGGGRKLNERQDPFQTFTIREWVIREVQEGFTPLLKNPPLLLQASSGEGDKGGEVKTQTVMEVNI